jgi:putative tryptophan/tyrosine transport system substrate-binding protein
MKRREFITLNGGGVAVPCACAASDAGNWDAMTSRLGAFRQGLKELGFAEGENVPVVYRWAENRVHGPSELAAELV